MYLYLCYVGTRRNKLILSRIWTTIWWAGLIGTCAWTSKGVPTGPRTSWTPRWSYSPRFRKLWSSPCSTRWDTFLNGSHAVLWESPFRRIRAYWNRLWSTSRSLLRRILLFLSFKIREYKIMCNNVSFSFIFICQIVFFSETVFFQNDKLTQNLSYWIWYFCIPLFHTWLPNLLNKIIDSRH